MAPQMTSASSPNRRMTMQSRCSKISAQRRATGVHVQLRRTTSWVMTRFACCRRLCRLR